MPTIVSTPRSKSAVLAIAARTSSRVAGTPPPFPTRRYSMFQAAQPRSWSERASGAPRSSPYCARQKPPCTITARPFGAASGR